MEQSYYRVLLYRNAARATCVSVVACPGAQSALTALLTIEKSIQQIIKTYWDEQQKVWNTELPNRCNLGLFAKGSAFPDFPYALVDPALGLGGVEEMVALYEPKDDLVLKITEYKLSSEATAWRYHAAKWGAHWTE